jgi:hypothetical protein
MAWQNPANSSAAGGASDQHKIGAPGLGGALMQVVDAVQEVVLGVPAEGGKQSAKVQPRMRQPLHLKHNHMCTLVP